MSLGSHTEHCTTAKLSLTRKESVYEAINQRCGGYPIQNDEMRDERRGENSLKINDEVSRVELVSDLFAGQCVFECLADSRESGSGI